MLKKNLIVFGTRPEAIKMAPLVQKFMEQEDFETRVCVTAQHREMLDQVLSFFELSPHYDLDLMRSGQSLHALTARIIKGMKPVLEDFKPDYVFVHGDTTTTMVVALAAFYSGAKVCHIEAGLRTFRKRNPFPEEMNRSIVGRIADYHFAPTTKAKENLLL
ncbi:MAG TPA: UDP-N-acetylglucosamine 2-epimerase (non-hydrolyzing), partial [Aequorivita sp.]|nr:UDP-N-acetylglucosamine 2-epimerase (non-hydrolyzing) [Aequorivita sp.]